MPVWLWTTTKNNVESFASSASGTSDTNHRALSADIEYRFYIQTHEAVQRNATRKRNDALRLVVCFAFCRIVALYARKSGGRTGNLCTPKSYFFVRWLETLRHGRYKTKYMVMVKLVFVIHVDARTLTNALFGAAQTRTHTITVYTHSNTCVY